MNNLPCWSVIFSLGTLNFLEAFSKASSLVRPLTQYSPSLGWKGDGKRLGSTWFGSMISVGTWVYRAECCNTQTVNHVFIGRGSFWHVKFSASNNPVRSSNNSVRSSNYPVRSSNNQVRSSNYPVRSSNNQVRSSNYPVRSSNNSVRSSNYPVRSSNNQVRSSNYPVRSSNNSVRSSNYPVRSSNNQVRSSNNSVRSSK